MGTLIKKVIFNINGNVYQGEKSEAYNFLRISLTQQLLKPNELRFTMQKKNIAQSINSADFPVPAKLMGAKVYCKIITEYYKDNDALSEDEIEFNGIAFSVNVYPGLGTCSEQLIDVIAYSSDYLLTDHPHCFSYEDMTLKNIVAKTLNPHQIKNEINPRTTVSIPYTVQYNESNFQFLTRLAKRYGEWMYHDGEKWVFGKMVKKDVVELHARNDIISYQFQSNLLHHKLKHAHHNYMDYDNPNKSNADFPDLTAPKYYPLTDAAQKESTNWFGKETFQHLQCSNPEFNDIDELEVSAKAQLFGEKTQQTVCNGSSVRSNLTIGSRIKIFDIDYVDKKKFKFFPYEEMIITGIVHSTEANGYYSNFFTAVPSKCEYPPYFQSDIYPVSAAQRAKVMDNKDPKKLGRIRVQFLWQEEQDANLMTPWIRIAQPHGGDDKGFYFIPEIDEEVMVDFENGNAEKPYVVGTLWHGKQHPGAKWPTDSNDIKAIRTRNGHTIEIHDEGSDGYIRIYDYKKENYILTFSTDKKLIKLESTGNIELYASNDIIMEAGHDIKMKAKHDKIVDVDHNLSVTVDGAKSVSAGSITEESGSSMKLKSKTHEQKADATMKLEAGATLEIKGAIVKIN